MQLAKVQPRVVGDFHSLRITAQRHGSCRCDVRSNHVDGASGDKADTLFGRRRGQGQAKESGSDQLQHRSVDDVRVRLEESLTRAVFGVKNLNCKVARSGIHNFVAVKRLFNG